MINNKLSRRAFITSSAKLLVTLPSAGLLLGGCIQTPDGLGDKASKELSEVTPFVEVLPDASIRLIIHKQEMGQGVRTALATLLAEELDVSLAQVQIYSVPCDAKKYGRMDTGGSGSIYSSWEQLRVAGAAAREMFIQAAANYWSISVTGCETRQGRVTNIATGESLNYGELAPLAAQLEVPENPELKATKAFKLIGKAQKDLDVEAIVKGEILYAMDALPKNTVFASVERCPAAQGKLIDFDASQVVKIPGVIGVYGIKPDNRINGNRAGVGIIASSYWVALKARDKLKVNWQLPKAVTNSEKGLQEYLASFSEDDAIIVADYGNPDAVTGPRKLQQTYYTPAQSQAHIEPLVCVAQVQAKNCQIWTGHQFPQTVSRRAAEFLNIAVENVSFQPFRMGGSFGRKYENDFVMEAVQLAKQVDVPVKVIWSREDDMQFGFYQTPSYHEMSATLDADNKPLSWVHNAVTTPYDRTAKAPIDSGDAQGAQEYTVLDIPNVRILSRSIPIDINRGAHRSVGNPSAQFAIGCFQDELAHAAGVDPISWFLSNLGKDRILPKGYYQQNAPKHRLYDTGRLRRCIEQVAKLSRWGQNLDGNIGLGFSAFRSQKTYCATVIKVTAVKDRIIINNIWHVTDCGLVVEPNGASQQVTGSLIFALSCALREKIYSVEHRVQQQNFHNYQLASMADVPEISIEFVESNDYPSGLGEPGVSGVAPALSNAIFAATGKRIRQIPFNDSVDFG